MRARPCLLLLPLALLAAGCGGTTIDSGKAESELVGMRTHDGVVRSAHCPGGVKPKSGKTYECKVVMANGAKGTWDIEVIDSKGLVRVSQDQLDVPSMDRLKAKGLAVGKSAVMSAPHGAKVRVTLVRYTPRVAEPSGDALARGVAGVELRIENIGNVPLRAKRPTYYAIARSDVGTGEDVVAKASGPCGGSFYRSPLDVAPGKSVEGCIPYRFVRPPVDFGFGFGIKLKRWALG